MDHLNLLHYLKININRSDIIGLYVQLQSEVNSEERIVVSKSLYYIGAIRLIVYSEYENYCYHIGKVKRDNYHDRFPP